jgi:hypothetical protein
MVGLRGHEGAQRRVVSEGSIGDLAGASDPRMLLGLAAAKMPGDLVQICVRQFGDFARRQDVRMLVGTLGVLGHNLILSALIE